MDRVRFGIVGCGAVARRHHLPALSTISDRAEVAALCDSDQESMDLLESRFTSKAKQYLELDELLADRSVDVVDICTPGFTHFEYAERAIRAGKHVLLEKPPVYTVAEAEHLKRLADLSGVKLGVVLNSRYKPLVEELKEAIDGGHLGTVIKLQMTHHANLVFSESQWLWDERRSKYLLYEFGIHHLDLMIHLCGEHDKVVFTLPTRQECINTTSDLQSIIQFKSGALGLLDFTQDSTRHSSYFTHIQVYGTAKDAFLRHFPPMLTYASGQLAPHEAVINELRSLGHFAYLLATGKVRNYRNRSHERVLDLYVSWIADDLPFPLKMESIIPTLRMLNELETHIPGYAVNEAAERAVVTL